MTYNVGDVATLTCSAAAPSGASYVPTVVTVSVMDPTGAVTSPTVTNVAPGQYTATVSLPTAGAWRYAWTASGGPLSLGATKPGILIVSPPP